PVAIAAELIALGCIAFGLRRLSRSDLFADDPASKQPVDAVLAVGSSTRAERDQLRRGGSAAAGIKPDTPLPQPRSRSTSS
ncbi:MAG: hypothetical protein ABIO16_17480, partial [Nocardioides sp.]